MMHRIEIPGGRIAEWATVNELLAARARQHGDAERIEIDGRAISFRACEERAATIAANLHKLGVGRGDRVSSFMLNSIEQLLVWFATNRIGAVWVPLNAGLVGEDLQHTLADARPRLIVVDEELAPRLENLPAAQGLPVYVAGKPAGNGGRAFAELLADAAPVPAADLGPGDPSVIIYTGGTTGLPKGVVLPHFALIAAGYRYMDAFGVTPSDRQFSVLTMYHGGGLGFGLMGPMVADIPTFVAKRFSASTFWTRVRETGATLVDLIGTMLTALMEQPESPLDREHGVRISLGGIAQLPAHIPDAFSARFGVPLLRIYALTEAGAILTFSNRVEGSPSPLANGAAWGWAEARIVDEHDVPLPAGKVGQITLRPLVPHIFMSGYYNNPAHSIAVFANQWLHTGDLGFLDEHGFLNFTGREAHWMRRRGENISAYEIETILSQYPGLREVIAVGVPSEKGEEDVKLFMIKTDGVDIDPADIARWCEGRMAAFKIPRFYEFVDDFPRSTTKREPERQKLKARPNESVWDREARVKA